MMKIFKKIGLLIIFLAIVVLCILVIKNAGNKNEENTKLENNTNSSNDVNIYSDTNDIKENIENNDNNSNNENNEKIDTDENNKDNKKTSDVDIIEIKDKLFIESTNEIYVNLKEYIGKYIKIEGLMYNYENEDGKMCHAVIRHTPGCCGNDGIAGLNISYDKEYPKDDTWVCVQGKINEWKAFDGVEQMMPIVEVEKISFPPTGKTFVTN